MINKISIRNTDKGLDYGLLIGLPLIALSGITLLNSSEEIEPFFLIPFAAGSASPIIGSQIGIKEEYIFDKKKQFQNFYQEYKEEKNYFLIGYRNFGISFGKPNKIYGINFGNTEEKTNGINFSFMASSNCNGMNICFHPNGWEPSSKINGISLNIFGSFERQLINGVDFGIFSFSEKTNGISLGFVFSGAVEHNGIIIGSIFSGCKKGHGLSIAPINASNIKGLSVGLINIGNSWLQIGLLNFDENRKLKFPIINTSLW